MGQDVKIVETAGKANVRFIADEPVSCLPETSIFGSLKVRSGGKRTLGDQRKRLNLDLHIIHIARPRYQENRPVPFVGPAFFLPDNLRQRPLYPRKQTLS